MEFDCLTVVPKTSTMLETTYVGNNLFRWGWSDCHIRWLVLSHLVGEVSEVTLDDDGLY
jgi:hypothetical protein